MKRLLVFLVLVGLAVPGWGQSRPRSGPSRTDDSLRWIEWNSKTDVFGIQSLGIDSSYSFNFFVPATLIYLGSTAQSMFDSVWVFPPKKCPNGGMVLRLKGFYVTPRYPSIAGWPEIYCIYADTIICKGRCGELTAKEVFKWLEDPDNESLWVPTYLDYIISKRRIR